MKLDYCNDHARKGEQYEACLAIRHDDGKTAKPREVWAEIERLRNVAQAADELMATLGADGEIDTTHPKTQKLLDALYEWRPLFAEVSNASAQGGERSAHPTGA